MISQNLNIGILGSTGSIGQNSLKVYHNLVKNGFNGNIFFLTANSNKNELLKQIDMFHPVYAYLNNNAAADLPEVYKNTKIISDYSELLNLISSDQYGILINSLVGFAGLIPTLEAIKADKKIALANKETLVVGGKIINDLLLKSKAKLFPIDSEHSAILQCLQGESPDSVHKIYLTASGGPFRTFSADQLKNVSVDQALNHPNWKMGKKITIDSATLMNKGLEVIEAKWLFNLAPEQIEVLIHPQSIIHSMVEFNDGSIKAQLGVPDMKIPIQYAITYPQRIASYFERLDFKKISSLDFSQPDFEKFKCLNLAYYVLKYNGTYAAVLNAANEIAVELFLNKKIGFNQIQEIIENELSIHKNISDFSVDDLLAVDKYTRENVMRLFS